MLTYFGRYKFLIVLAVLSSTGFAAMNTFSVYLVGPFLKTLFTYDQPVQVEQTETSEAPMKIGRLEAFKENFQTSFDNYMDKGSPRQKLTRICVLILIVVFLKNLFSYAQGYIMAYVGLGTVTSLRNDLYASYHRLPLRYFQRRKTGEMMSRVTNDCNVINENLNSAFLNLLREPINILVILFFMIIMSWWLTLITFIIAPLGVVVINRIGRKLRRRTINTQDRVADLTAVIEETISGIRVVKAFAMESFELKRFHKANRAYLKDLLKLFVIRRLAPPVVEFLGVCMAVGILWIGGIMILEHNALESQHFLAYLLLLFILMQSGKRLSEVNVKLQVGIAASERVFEIIDHPADVTDPPNPVPITEFRDKIEFRHVWYEYEQGVPVLKDIDFEIQAGENVAIVGPSGGGKSTLVDLLPRFFDPTSGSVMIDGRDLRDYRLDDLRRLYGIVTQETILFHDTIRANIAYGMPGIPMDDIINAAKTANAHDFIMGFEDGYDTMLGDRGTKLSGGQKQRLVIARAILKNPPVLLFDEATSALDSKAEADVQVAIEQLMKDRTSLVIAHRLSTIKSAGRIVVIDKGEIVESGTHDELYGKKGIYRRLYDLQFSDRYDSEQMG